MHTSLSPAESLDRATIISETRKLQHLYGLKREIRYGQSRGDAEGTESVAEHVFGMHILAMYFLPLEDPISSWDRTRISDLITIHDLDEVETGDTIGYLKTDAQRAAEADAMRLVIRTAPEHMQESMTHLVDEYEAQTSPEARFVKAIDRFEPLIHVYSEHGRHTLHTNQTTIEHSRQIKNSYVAPYPYLKRFTETLQAVLQEEGYFWTPNMPNT